MFVEVHNSTLKEAQAAGSVVLRDAAPAPAPGAGASRGRHDVCELSPSAFKMPAGVEILESVAREYASLLSSIGAPSTPTLPASGHRHAFHIAECVPPLCSFFPAAQARARSAQAHRALPHP